MGFQLKSGNKPSFEKGLVEPSQSIAVVDATPMKKYNHNKVVRKANREYDKYIKENEKAIQKDLKSGGSAFTKNSHYKEEDDDDDDNDFNMMDNTPETPEPADPEPEPDPEPQPEQEPEPEPEPEPEKEPETEEEKGKEEAKDVKEEVEQSEEAANEEYLDSYMQDNLGVTSDEIDSMKEVQEGKTETEKIEQSVKSDSEKMEEQYQKDMSEGKYEDNPEAAADDYLAMIDGKMSEDKESERDQYADHKTQAEFEQDAVEQTKEDIMEKGSAKVKKSASDAVEKKVLGDTIENKATTKVVENLAKHEAKATAKKQLAKKAALKVSGKVALKFIPGVNLISGAYDVFKLGQAAYKNKDHIASWGRRQSNNMKNKMNEWTA